MTNKVARTDRDLAVEPLGGATLAFRESSQGLYRLDSGSGGVLADIQRGFALRRAAGRLARRTGCDAPTARAYVAQAVRGWRACGLLRPRRRPDAPSEKRTAQARPAATGRAVPDGAPALDLDVCGLELNVTFGDRAVAAAVAPAFRHLPRGTGSGGIAVTIEADGSGWAIGVEGERHLAGVEPLALLPAVKRVMAELVLLCAPYDTAFHAAALSRGGRCLLIAGASGAGKTTLALALARHGHTVMTDDCALYHKDTGFRGLAMPAAVKQVLPAFAGGPLSLGTTEYHRMDGVTLRYAVPERMDFAARPLGWVAFPRREPRSDVSLVPLDGCTALLRLFDEAHMRRHRLGAAAFSRLAAALREARCFELHYADAGDAAAFLDAELGP